MKVLISGGGAAGLSAAINLSRSGHQVEVIERADHLRVNGSPIDVRGDALRTAQRMGILDEVQRRRITMTEQTRFIHPSGETAAFLSLEQINEESEDIELPREDLMNILGDALPDEVNLRFEESIRSVEDSGDQVAVTFASGYEDTYDLLIGADGAHSLTRRLVFGPEKEFAERLGVYVALADAPQEAASGEDRITEILNLPGRFAGVARYHDQALAIFEFRGEAEDYDHRDMEAQKRILTEAFADVTDWKVPELLATAQQDGQLFFDDLSLIRMPQWHQGRVVLVGDAAYCATPMAGRGTSLALLGAEILAEEIARYGEDLEAAFCAYEKRQRPYVDSAQEFARGGADMVVPATWEDIEARNEQLQQMGSQLSEG